jgi:hypothetical protein
MTLRTNRTFGVTAALEPIQRRNLTALRNSEVYDDLLDVMEMVCIEQETELINTDPADESAVLARHKMAKAAWQIFTGVQEKILSESQQHMRTVDKTPPIPPRTVQEQWMDATLDPTIPEPESTNGLRNFERWPT